MKKKYKSPYKPLKPVVRFECRTTSGKKHVKVGGFYGISYCEEYPLRPARGIVQSLVFSSLLVGFGTIVYLIINV